MLPASIAAGFLLTVTSESDYRQSERVKRRYYVFRSKPRLL